MVFSAMTSKTSKPNRKCNPPDTPQQWGDRLKSQNIYPSAANIIVQVSFQSLSSNTPSISIVLLSFSSILLTKSLTSFSEQTLFLHRPFRMAFRTITLTFLFSANFIAFLSREENVQSLSIQTEMLSSSPLPRFIFFVEHIPVTSLFFRC